MSYLYRVASLFLFWQYSIQTVEKQKGKIKYLSYSFLSFCFHAFLLFPISITKPLLLRITIHFKTFIWNSWNQVLYQLSVNITGNVLFKLAIVLIVVRMSGPQKMGQKNRGETFQNENQFITQNSCFSLEIFIFDLHCYAKITSLRVFYLPLQFCRETFKYRIRTAKQYSKFILSFFPFLIIFSLISKTNI